MDNLIFFSFRLVVEKYASIFFHKMITNLVRTIQDFMYICMAFALFHIKNNQ